MSGRAWFYAQGQRWATLNPWADFWELSIMAGVGRVGWCVPPFVVGAFCEGVRDARKP